MAQRSVVYLVASLAVEMAPLLVVVRVGSTVASKELCLVAVWVGGKAAMWG